MSQTALSTAAAALTLAGTTAPKQTTGFLGKGKNPVGQPPGGGGPPGGSGGGGLPGGPPAGGGPFRPPGGVPRGGGNGKLGGNPPDTFDGDRAMVDQFMNVTDLQGPPSERMQTEKIRDLKSLARQYARDQGSCDDTRISYLEYVESEAEADWTLARMIAG
jgi:hypothetical protein